MHSSQRPTKPDAEAPAAPRPDGVQLRARRSPKLIAMGVLLVVLGGIGAGVLYTMNADQQTVVVMASDVRRGDVLAREHLAVVEVPGSLGVEALPADDLASLVGQPARGDLPKGAFPLARHVGGESLPAGHSIVGLRLALGQLPTVDLPPGTQVRLVGLAEGSAQTAAAVIATRPVLLDDAATYTLDVQVADADADAIARLGAAGELALIVVTGGS